MASDSHGGPTVRATDAFRVALAVWHLRRDGVVLHATEGVWGLACDPFSRRAVAHVLRAKARSWRQGLIVIGDSAATFHEELSAVRDPASVTSSWPGPVTWLVPSRRFPRWVTGGRPTVAVRVPGHAQARRLAAAFGGPLVSTSANLSGQPAPTTALAARAAMARRVSYMLHGATSGPPRSSQILVADSKLVIRG